MMLFVASTSANPKSGRPDRLEENLNINQSPSFKLAIFLVSRTQHI